MTQDKDRNGEKKADPNTWTAYGDPVKDDNSSSTLNNNNKNSKSPILEKAQQDGNIVKRL